MDDILISIIIPVYKAENYLDQCVKSVMNQTYKNLEIILVDDGSPDRCGQMCDAYAEQDSRIRVIHKANGGQSSARNAALDIASGEYIGFVDSDDYIEPEMYQTLVELASSHHAEISACGLQCDFPDGRCVYFNSDYPQNQQTEVFSKLDALREVTITKKVTNSPCDKLFRRYIFDDIRMSEGKVYEDFEMMPKCLDKITKLAYTPVPLYHYNMTHDSTTRGAFKESMFGEADVSRDIVALYAQKYPQLYPYALARHIEICLILVQSSASSKEFSAKRNALIQELKVCSNREAFSLLSKKNKLKYVLCRVSPNIYSRLMTLYYNR